MNNITQMRLSRKQMIDAVNKLPLTESQLRTVHCNNNVTLNGINGFCNDDPNGTFHIDSKNHIVTVRYIQLLDMIKRYDVKTAEALNAAINFVVMMYPI